MNNQTFARRLSYLLWAHQLRQGEAAKLMGIHPSTMSRAVNGRAISVDTMIIIAGYFQVSLDWLNGKGRIEIY